MTLISLEFVTAACTVYQKYPTPGSISKRPFWHDHCSRPFQVKNASTRFVGDISFYLLRTSFLKFLLCILLLYASLIVLYAVVYSLDPKSLRCMLLDDPEPCTFTHALDFSARTMSGLGYTSILPNDLLANIMLVVEFWNSVLLAAMAGGGLINRGPKMS